MQFAPCIQELRDGWFPHTTDAGLARLIELLEGASPMLIHGAFTRAMPMGCLATHIAWHHPETEGLMCEAGVRWLTREAGLNPATSQVIRAWDNGGVQDWELRSTILASFKEEQARRQRLADAAYEDSFAELMSV